MGKITDFLKKIKFHLFLNAYHQTHTLTPKGEMVMYYILNKYINRTKPEDYIESYEASITQDEERFIPVAQKCVNVLPPELQGENPEKTARAMAHVFSAMHLFEIMLIAIPSSDREIWLERMNDPTMRAKMRNKIKKSIN